jgi:hypothetical protein
MKDIDFEKLEKHFLASDDVRREWKKALDDEKNPARREALKNMVFARMYGETKN